VAAVLALGISLAGCGGAMPSSVSRQSDSPSHIAASSTSPTAATVKVQGSWSEGTQVSPVPDDVLGGVSCLSSSYCVAIGTLDAYTHTNGTWSGGASVEAQTELALESVSCPSTAFCAAVDSGGNAFMEANGAWLTPQQLTLTVGELDLRSVSCPTVSFCVAVGSAASGPGMQITATSGKAVAFTYTNGTWSSAMDIGSADQLTSISCPSTSFCASVGETFKGSTFTGYGYTIKNDRWSPREVLGSSFAPTSIACSISSFCEAVGAVGTIDSPNSTLDGAAVTYSAGAWSSARTIAPRHTFTAVSCPSRSSCMAVGMSENSPEAADESACSSAYADGNWSAAVPVGPTINDLAGVSCPTTTFCLAGGTTTASPGSDSMATVYAYSGNF
jgi:hypothetical protein